MTNKWQWYLLKLKNTNYQNINRFIAWKPWRSNASESIFHYYFTVLLKQYLTLSKQTCYKTDRYFNFKYVDTIYLSGA